MKASKAEHSESKEEEEGDSETADKGAAAARTDTEESSDTMREKTVKTKKTTKPLKRVTPREYDEACPKIMVEDTAVCRPWTPMEGTDIISSPHNPLTDPVKFHQWLKCNFVQLIS